jgi:hypothetical protein
MTHGPYYALMNVGLKNVRRPEIGVVFHDHVMH